MFTGEYRSLDYLRAMYVSAYVEPHVHTKAEASWWVKFILKLDSNDYGILYTHTDDPFPWRPFLLLMRSIVVRWPSYQKEYEEYERSLRELMDEQGLSKVELNDTLWELGLEVHTDYRTPRWEKRVAIPKK